jgi:GntR family transcriptional regulator
MLLSMDRLADVVTAEVPKYYRIKESILGLVEGLAPGTLIPTERALAQRYDTSRTTIRQAIAELVAEGVLDRTQGRGTFVAPPKLTYVRQLTSFSDDAREQGRDVSSTILGVDRVAVPAAAAARLNLAPDALVHRVERVRLVDGEPLAHEVALLPGELPGLHRHLRRLGSLYAVLRQVYGIELADVEDTVETALAGPDEVRLLDTEIGTPLLVVHRLAHDLSGRPVELTRSAFRGDRFRFVARHRAGDAADPVRSRGRPASS